jgi:hypothetical protein
MDSTLRGYFWDRLKEIACELTSKESLAFDIHANEENALFRLLSFPTKERMYKYLVHRKLSDENSVVITKNFRRWSRDAMGIHFHRPYLDYGRPYLVVLSTTNGYSGNMKKPAENTTWSEIVNSFESIQPPPATPVLDKPKRQP